MTFERVPLVAVKAPGKGNRKPHLAELRQSLLELPEGEALILPNDGEYAKYYGRGRRLEATLKLGRSHGCPVRQRKVNGVIYLWLDRSAATTGGAA